MIAVTLQSPFIQPNIAQNIKDTNNDNENNNNTITNQYQFNPIEFYSFCTTSFSTFSQPLFVRFIHPNNRDDTGTFKLKKSLLRAQGVEFFLQNDSSDEKKNQNINNIANNNTHTPTVKKAIDMSNTNGDIVFFVDHVKKSYKLLTPEVWDKICSKQAKL
jgi:hypothetical protein